MIKLTILTIHILLYYVFSIAEVYAQNKKDNVYPLETDRPDQTEFAAVVPAKSLQMEVGYLSEYSDNGSGGVDVFGTMPTSLFRYGLLKSLELRLIVELTQYYDLRKKSTPKQWGINPIAIGTKVAICEEKGLRPKMAMIVDFNIPKLTTKELAPTYIAPDTRINFEHTLSDKFSFAYNLGASWDGEAAGATGEYTFVIGYSATEKFGVYAEAFGFLPEQSHPQNLLDGGVTYLCRPNLQLDASVGFGISPEASPGYWSVGFCWRIPR